MPIPTNLQFRQATRDDMPTIVKILSEDMLGTQREHFETPLPKAYYDAFEAIKREPNHELIVVEKDGQIVGSMQLMFLPSLSYQGGTRAQVETVQVAKEFRGQGIGTEMIKWTFERARQRGCRLMQLTSHKSRLDAHRFYERLGFDKSHVGMKLIF